MGDALEQVVRPNATPAPAWRARAVAFVTSWAFDAIIVGSSAAAALVFGLIHSGLPSFWHDELVHVFVAKHLAEVGRPLLPSGVSYYNGTIFHTVLAAVYALFGNSEVAMRAPSAVFAGSNVVLTYWVVRPLLGRGPALVAAIGMALSPWNVAWSRQARFYTLHQGMYIAFVGMVWHLAIANAPRRAAGYAVAAGLAFAFGLLTSFHALIYLAAPGLFAVIMAIATRHWRTRWTALVLGVALAGIAGIAALQGLMNPVDRAAIVDNGGLGGQLVFPERSTRLYYLEWLAQNLSRGFLALALVGSLWMVLREKRSGLYAALAFWAPFAVLTFLIGYRWPKFMFFAYPFFIAAWAYAIVRLVEWLALPKPHWPRRIAAAVLALFLARLGVSAVRLTQDSIEIASGTNLTLAARHPEWRAPCLWVRERMEGAAILTTSFLPVYHYIGQVHEWYPSRALPAESVESGLSGLESIHQLQRFMSAYPNGYFISEWWRFERNYKGAPWADFSEDIAWVNANMRRIDAASTADVTVYAWGNVPDE